MSNIDKQALREIAVAAVGAHERLSGMSPDDIFDISLAEGTQLDADITALNALNSAANPATVLALLDELEAAERERDNWRTCFDNERFRADKLAVAFKTEHEQLVMANGALITKRMMANGAEKRIAELEAREKSLRTVGVMSAKAFQRLEGRESRFIALWPRPEIYLQRKRPEDGVIVYARVAGTAKGE